MIDYSTTKYAHPYGLNAPRLLHSFSIHSIWMRDLDNKESSRCGSQQHCPLPPAAAQYQQRAAAGGLLTAVSNSVPTGPAIAQQHHLASNQPLRPVGQLQQPQQQQQQFAHGGQQQPPTLFVRTTRQAYQVWWWRFHRIFVYSIQLPFWLFAFLYLMLSSMPGLLYMITTAIRSASFNTYSWCSVALTTDNRILDQRIGTIWCAISVNTYKLFVGYLW